MKTEEEIRKRIADTKVVIANQSCGCAATGHAEECRIGGLMVKASIGLLEWVLGEDPGEEYFAELLSASAARWRGTNEPARQ